MFLSFLLTILVLPLWAQDPSSEVPRPLFPPGRVLTPTPKPPQKKLPFSPNRPLVEADKKKGDLVRSLRYATNREYNVAAEGNDGFEPIIPFLEKHGSDRAATGKLSVMVRRDRHLRGDIRNPKGVDGKRTFEIIKLDRGDHLHEDICPSITEEAALDNEEITVDQKDLLVFVHGYNTTFNEAALRAAQLQQDLGWNKVMVLSWYSAGNVAYYTSNQKNAGEVAPPVFAPLIDELQHCWKGHLRFITHSMGNYCFLETVAQLKDLSIRNKSMPNLGRWVLLAPDANIGRSEEILSKTLSMFEKVVHYFSTKDWTMTLSEFRNPVNEGQDPRRAGNNFVKVQGLESINADAVNLGDKHSYYANSIAVLDDIKRVFTLPLENLKDPRSRNAPIRLQKEGYYEFIAPPGGMGSQP